MRKHEKRCESYTAIPTRDQKLNYWRIGMLEKFVGSVHYTGISHSAVACPWARYFSEITDFFFTQTLKIPPHPSPCSLLCHSFNILLDVHLFVCFLPSAMLLERNQLKDSHPQNVHFVCIVTTQTQPARNRPRHEYIQVFGNPTPPYDDKKLSKISGT